MEFNLRLDGWRGVTTQTKGWRKFQKEEITNDVPQSNQSTGSVREVERDGNGNGESKMEDKVANHRQRGQHEAINNGRAQEETGVMTK